jgi:hypothetical protein
MRHIIFLSILISFTVTVLGQKSKFLLGQKNATPQKLISKYSISQFPSAKFSFTKLWDYPAFTIKDDSGHFEIMEQRELIADDTAHLFYTAKCTTNVQGGYAIRYCYATKNKNKITLTFSDGMPAYASSFYVYIQDSTFACLVETVYPAFIQGEQRSILISKQKLVLNQSKFTQDDVMEGYIEIAFIETSIIPKKGVHKTPFYLKGFFKIKITKELEP